MPDEWALSDRRTYLKYAGAAGVTALAGCVGGNGSKDANHEVPHPDDETVPDAERTAQSLNGRERPENVMVEKADVGYSHTPDGDRYCGNCTLYVPDGDGDGFGACVTVAGKIHPCDHCNYWGPYQGDDTIPCED